MKKFAGLITASFVAATLTACNDKDAKQKLQKLRLLLMTLCISTLGLNMYQMVF